MKENLLSVGIDLGTTTTQIVFSRIVLEISNATAVPDVRISDKEILYRSKIYFTPVLGNGKDINMDAIAEILEKEYSMAGINKEDITTGAVIITGETARKENAERVLHDLADFAGDFVVATAGADLESVLAGYGAGAAEYSKQETKGILNFDIGGGTTNAVLFSNGNIEETFALDIGGRLIRIGEDGKINYVSERLYRFMSEIGLDIHLGEKADYGKLSMLADGLAKILTGISAGRLLTQGEKSLFIGHEAEIAMPHKVMFSGGVAEFTEDCHDMSSPEKYSQYGDFGPLLGNKIYKAFKAEGIDILRAKERIRATVIGAGSYSLHISGSTISAEASALPMKNVPVLYINNNDPQMISQALQQKLHIFPDRMPAISFSGKQSPSYVEVKALAKAIAEGLQERNPDNLIVLMEADFAKALGMLLKQELPDINVICLDCIRARDGDYADIGKPLGSVVPVVVKTLVFNE